MQLTQFRSKRAAMQGNAAAASGRELEFAENLVLTRLSAAGLFHSVEVECTEDRDRLVIGMVGFEPGLDQAQISAELERIWGEELSYDFWRVHSVTIDDDQVELLGATRASRLHNYVTVDIIARPVPVSPILPRQTAPTGSAIETSAVLPNQRSDRQRRGLGRLLGR